MLEHPFSWKGVRFWYFQYRIQNIFWGGGGGKKRKMEVFSPSEIVLECNPWPPGFASDFYLKLFLYKKHSDTPPFTSTHTCYSHKSNFGTFEHHHFKWNIMTKMIVTFWWCIVCLFGRQWQQIVWHDTWWCLARLCVYVYLHDHDESIKPLALDQSRFSQTHKITNIGIIICHSIDLQFSSLFPSHYTSKWVIRC